MDDPQDKKNYGYLWSNDPLDSEEMIRELSPLLVSLLGLVQKKPRYIRSVRLKNGAIIQMVTTPTLKNGYIARSADTFLLCKIYSREGSEQAVLTLVGVHKILEDADAWIAEGRI